MSSSSSDTCYGTSNSCPLTSITSCTHSEDVTVECSKKDICMYRESTIFPSAYSTSYSKANTTKNTCGKIV